MMHGELLMLTWPADSLVSLQQEQLLFHLHSLAKELGPSSWMMLDALVLKPDLWIVLIGELACITVHTLKMLVFDVEICQHVQMVTSVFEALGLQTQVVVLRFATTMHGAQYVMTSGTILMPMWSADSLGLLQQAQRPFLKLHLAKELEQSFWTMLPVVVLKPDLWTALAIQLAFTTVPTLKMLVSDVWVVPLETLDLLMDRLQMKAEWKCA